MGFDLSPDGQPVVVHWGATASFMSDAAKPSSDPVALLQRPSSDRRPTSAGGFKCSTTSRVRASPRPRESSSPCDTPRTSVLDPGFMTLLDEEVPYEQANTVIGDFEPVRSRLHPLVGPIARTGADEPTAHTPIRRARAATGLQSLLSRRSPSTRRCSRSLMSARPTRRSPARTLSVPTGLAIIDR